MSWGDWLGVEIRKTGVQVTQVFFRFWLLYVAALAVTCGFAGYLCGSGSPWRALLIGASGAALVVVPFLLGRWIARP